MISQFPSRPARIVQSATSIAPFGGRICRAARQPTPFQHVRLFLTIRHESRSAVEAALAMPAVGEMPFRTKHQKSL